MMARVQEFRVGSIVTWKRYVAGKKRAVVKYGRVEKVRSPFLTVIEQTKTGKKKVSSQGYPIRADLLIWGWGSKVQLVSGS